MENKVAKVSMQICAARMPNKSRQAAHAFVLAEIVVVICLITAFSALAIRVTYLQTYGRQQTIRQTDRQHHQTQALPSRRGDGRQDSGHLQPGRACEADIFTTGKDEQQFGDDQKQ